MILQSYYLDILKKLCHFYKLHLKTEIKINRATVWLENDCQPSPLSYNTVLCIRRDRSMFDCQNGSSIEDACRKYLEELLRGATLSLNFGRPDIHLPIFKTIEELAIWLDLRA